MSVAEMELLQKARLICSLPTAGRNNTVAFCLAPLITGLFQGSEKLKSLVRAPCKSGLSYDATLFWFIEPSCSEGAFVHHGAYLLHRQLRFPSAFILSSELNFGTED
jgi:hypothetical protein